ncbi:PEMT/PEM2 family methyltransferase [Spirosoma soli]|uniref:PEMT/PEM2 family methyltransferase n=1 Tax=Spirosoma soli TaxID=1770529 RepID=A0ABW5M4A4_9BACT
MKRKNLFVRLVEANLESAGIILDRLTPLRGIVIATIIVSLILDPFVQANVTTTGAIVYAISFFIARQWFLMASFGAQGIASWLKRKYGVAQGGDWYEFITALFFYHRSYSYSLLLNKTHFIGLEALLPYEPYLLVIGWLLISLGLVVNTWSYLLIGREAYYYLDMYYGRFFKPFVAEGPYKYLNNPMYSVGQLPAYGAALMAGSGVGLVLAVLNQIACYIFYHRYERPHIEAVLAKQAQPA